MPVKPPELFAAVGDGVGVAVGIFVGTGVAVGTLTGVGGTYIVGVSVGLGDGVGVGGSGEGDGGGVGVFLSGIFGTFAGASISWLAKPGLLVSPMCRPGMKSRASVMTAPRMIAISRPMTSQITRRRRPVGAAGFVPACTKSRGRGVSSSLAASDGMGVGGAAIGGATIGVGMAALILSKPGLLLLMDAPFQGDGGGATMPGLPNPGFEGEL